jgi:hypothetical protein
MPTTLKVLGTLLVFCACSFMFVMVWMYFDAERQEAFEWECIDLLYLSA